MTKVVELPEGQRIFSTSMRFAQRRLRLIFGVHENCFTTILTSLRSLDALVLPLLGVIVPLVEVTLVRTSSINSLTSVRPCRHRFCLLIHVVVYGLLSPTCNSCLRSGTCEVPAPAAYVCLSAKLRWRVLLPPKDYNWLLCRPPSQDLEEELLLFLCQEPRDWGATSSFLLRSSPRDDL